MLEISIVMWVFGCLFLFYSHMFLRKNHKKRKKNTYIRWNIFAVILLLIGFVFFFL